MSEEVSIRKRVVEYVAELYGIPVHLLNDEFDVHGLLLSVEGSSPPEDYLHFWDDFVRDFAIYDAALTFDAYWSAKKRTTFLKPVARLLFSMGLVGPSYEMHRMTIGDLVKSAEMKKPAPGILRRISY